MNELTKEARLLASSVEFLRGTRVVECLCWNTCKNHDRQKGNRLNNSLSCTLKSVYILDNGQCAYFTPVEDAESEELNK